jgi:hypothetical protein
MRREVEGRFATEARACWTGRAFQLFSCHQLTNPSSRTNPWRFVSNQKRKEFVTADTSPLVFRRKSAEAIENGRDSVAPFHPLNLTVHGTTKIALDANGHDAHILDDGGKDVKVPIAEKVAHSSKCCGPTR